MAVQVKLEAERDRHKEDRAQAEQHLSEIDRRRDDAIRAAAADGMTRRRIAGIMGLSFQRVQQIVTRKSE